MVYLECWAGAIAIHIATPYGRRYDVNSGLRDRFGKQVEIEVASLALGVQVEAEWLPLLGIVYEPRTDVVEIALEGLDHMIRRPREIYADEEGIGLASLEIVEGGDVRHIVRLREPLLLPPPSQPLSQESLREPTRR
jgi:hypothetical protein